MAVPAPLPPDSFAFGVFGDGPYAPWESGRFRHLIEDVNGADLEWFLHVGDLFSHPCSDDMYEDRLAAINAIVHPVIYTPGDNEWTDCHESNAGGYAPLERLEHLRALYFRDAGLSLGGRPMAVESQGRDPAWAEFVENVRWTFGGFAFATLHLVGSGNATEAFEGRTAADDRAGARRTAAALAWMEETFALATATGRTGVVLAFHGNPDLERRSGPGSGHRAFVDRLEALAKMFAGPVLLIHGDSHRQRMDQPLVDRTSGVRLANLTRIETFGSPDIGWLRVVVDSVAGRVIEVEPRRMPRWGLR